MAEFIDKFKISPKFVEIIEKIKQNEKKIYISGLVAAAQSVFLGSLISKLNRPLLIMVQTYSEAERIFAELKSFCPVEFFNGNYSLLYKLLKGENLSIVTTSQAVNLPVISKEKLQFSQIEITAGRRQYILSPEKLIRLGYQRVPMTEETGDFSLRGGIIDVFIPGRSHPVRIEFCGDRVESIREFEVTSQQSIKKLNQIEILPLPQEQNCLDSGFLLDYLPPSTLLFVDQTNLESTLQTLIITPLPLKADSVNFETKAAQSYLERISEIEKEACETFFISSQPRRLKEVLLREGFSAPVFEGYLESGFLDKDTGLRIFSDKEIFGEVFHPGKYKPQTRPHPNPELLAEFKEGNYIVHSAYGIGIYQGLKKLTIDLTEQEFILIEFAQEDYLYIPVEKMKEISKYLTFGERKPKLNKLKDKAWLKTRQKAKKSTEKLARELFELYSLRDREKGFAFPPDTVWQTELEKSFPYVETPDQQIAISQIKRDMESEKPMERLLCGDVGYGKTEVALRAAFKAAAAGKQTVILVPTTILAEQHYQTFSERLKPFPFVVEMLSRFKTKTEQKQIIASLKTGGVDIVIGTQRLLQKDVGLKDLGLLIIDEEQRFGVSHKEKLKKLKKIVDVLTLSATPIPRTLYAALSGIREMSTIQTSPPGRLAIKTVLSPWDKKLIQTAVEKELSRGGQVFFVHNYVRDIKNMSDYIKKIVPQAKVGAAHGRLPAKQLEEIIYKFIKGEFNILVSTSIIESGLDLPQVNTIIINQAERFGLADLYQLRGRVGRGNVEAYAYLLYRPENLKTENMLARLSAIKEFTALGSGYRLAQKDLELRGAGDLLGREQHGHLEAVGFELYTEMLKESVSRLKEKEVKPKKEIYIDLKMNLYIPADYVEDEKQRISYYKRMYNAAALFELNNLKKEMCDRFGPLPQTARNLFEVAEIKLLAEAAGVKSITEKDNRIRFEYYEKKTTIIAPSPNLLYDIKQKLCEI